MDKKIKNLPNLPVYNERPEKPFQGIAEAFNDLRDLLKAMHNKECTAVTKIRAMSRPSLLSRLLFRNGNGNGIMNPALKNQEDETVEVESKAVKSEFEFEKALGKIKDQVEACLAGMPLVAAVELEILRRVLDDLGFKEAIDFIQLNTTGEQSDRLRSKDLWTKSQEIKNLTKNGSSKKLKLEWKEGYEIHVRVVDDYAKHIAPRSKRVLKIDVQIIAGSEALKGKFEALDAKVSEYYPRAYKPTTVFIENYECPVPVSGERKYNVCWSIMIPEKDFCDDERAVAPLTSAAQSVE